MRTVETQIEFFAANQEGIIDVARNHIGFVHVETLKCSIQVSARHNLLQLVDFFQQENAIALRFVVGFDDPGRIRVLLKLVQENGVFV